MNSRRRSYTKNRRKKNSILSKIGMFILMLTATACVALAVILMLESRLETDGWATSTLQAFGNNAAAPAMAEQMLQLDGQDFVWNDAFGTPVSPPTQPEMRDEPPAHTELPPEVEYIPTQTLATTTPTAIKAPPPPPPPKIFINPTPREPSNSPFSAFSFYIPENAHLYEYFANIRYDLDNETIVWKVNAHLHTPFYSQVFVNNDPNPLLINPFYRLPPDFTPHALVPVNHAECFLRATPETVAAFHTLRAAAQAVGLDLSATSAYRPASRQAYLWRRQGYRDGAVARPYHSEHQTGRALDLWGPGGLLDARGPSATGIWVANNAHYHGFIIRYRADTTHITGYIHEPWHITYVGLELSMYMHVNNILSLEEFVGRNPSATLPPVG